MFYRPNLLILSPTPHTPLEWRLCTGTAFGSFLFPKVPQGPYTQYKLSKYLFN